MVRTPSHDKSGLKKGTWTPEEDRKLIAYVTRYGCWNWRQLPRFAGLQRCGKSCRLRWMNYLRPNIKRGNYTIEEEETIIKLHASLGNRWSAIAAKLPGRTDNEVKNHWHTNLKKRVNDNDTHQEKSKPSNSSSNSDDNCENKVSDQLPKNNNNTSRPNDHHQEAPLHILESSTLSSSQPSPSDETSTMSSDICTETSSYMAYADSISNTSFEAFNADDQFSGNFWTEPFLADNSFIASELLTPLIDLEYFSPVLFDESPLCSTAFYMEHGVLY